MGKIQSFINKFSSKKYISYLKKLGAHIGKGTWFVSPLHTHFDEKRVKWISIGENCVICSGVAILAHDHSFSIMRNINSNDINFTNVKPIVIGNNCFIGENSIILPGVRIGNNVIIGAGSVVTKNIPDNCVAYGNPCSERKSILVSFDEGKKKIIDNLCYTYKVYFEINGVYPLEKDMPQLKRVYGICFLDGEARVCFNSFDELDKYIKQKIHVN